MIGSKSTVVACVFVLALVVAGCGGGALAAGDSRTCAQFADGRLTCWGSNAWGPLALGNNSGNQRKVGDQPNETGDSLAVAVDLG